MWPVDAIRKSDSRKGGRQFPTDHGPRTPYLDRACVLGNDRTLPRHPSCGGDSLIQPRKGSRRGYCSEWPDYVEFEFATAEPVDRTKPSDSDLLEKVHQTSNGEGC